MASAVADGSTALRWAGHRDDAATVARLLDAGADVDAATDLGVTALWAASQNASAALAETLLEAGADPNRPLLA
ncbi:MAG: ankyrin repeat domain-containing protein, partial [Acidobacteria bacterium]|nr:ankyrin repeat domain-containing protein [Acidobacteriota bacterium]